MKKRPLVLYLFSMAMMLVSLNIPFQAVYLMDFENLMMSLTSLNMLVMVLSFLTSLAIYNLHPSFRMLIPATALAVIINNWWVGYVGFNFNLIETSLASVGFLALHVVFAEKKTRRLILNPKLKWWHEAKRFHVEIPVVLTPTINRPEIIKRSFDISETGFFLQGFDEKELNHLKIGDRYDVFLQFSSILRIRCPARIVRKATSNGHYPSGVGLRFERNDPKIKMVLKNLELKNSIYEQTA